MGDVEAMPEPEAAASLADVPFLRLSADADTIAQIDALIGVVVTQIARSGFAEAEVGPVLARANAMLTAAAGRCDEDLPPSDAYLIRRGGKVYLRCYHDPVHEIIMKGR